MIIKSIKNLLKSQKKVIIFSVAALMVVVSISIILNYYVFQSDNSVYTSNETLPDPQSTSGKLAIIIDDFGQNRDGVKEMMSINRHLTFAVMPFLTFTKTDAIGAKDNNHEVIVHLPLESTQGPISWVGPKPIMTAMTDSEVQELTINAIEDVPYAVGANIHMGAKAGDDPRVISDILDVMLEKNFYFVDSRASKNPIAKKIANKKGAICFDRNVFIDGKKSKDHIIKQLKRSCDIALKYGKAVAIGHVGTEGGIKTAKAIIEMLPYFDENNIELVYVSELIEKK